jgi:hypothetical protein
MVRNYVNYEWELEVYVPLVFPLSMYVSRRTSDMTLDKLDEPVLKSETVQAVSRIDGVTRKNKITIGQGSPVAATTAEEPHQAVTKTTEILPELGDFTFYCFINMLISAYAWHCSA